MFDIHDVDFSLYKNRELEWNVKDKYTGSREMVRNVLCSMPINRAEEFNAPPGISGGAFFEDCFQKKPGAYGVSIFFFNLAFSCLIHSLYASTRASYIFPLFA